MLETFLRLFEKLLHWLTPMFIYMTGQRNGKIKEQRDAAYHAAALTRQQQSRAMQIQNDVARLPAAERLKRLRAKWQSVGQSSDKS
jgi:hypothetical protein